MEPEYSITLIAPTVCKALKLPALPRAPNRAIDAIVKDLEGRGQIAILVTDALGEYPFRKWKGEMPFMRALHGHHRILLRSVDPPVTAVNFATIVSGVALEVHGVDDPRDDFRCETLFDAVRKVGGRSAGIGREGYTGAELMGRFADLCGRASTLEKDEGVERLTLEIAEEHTPQLLIAQLAITDDVLHQYGPSSPMVVPVLRETDGRVERLHRRLTSLGYGMIVLADHGMHDVEKSRWKPGDHLGLHDQIEMDSDSLIACTWSAARQTNQQPYEVR